MLSVRSLQDTLFLPYSLNYDVCDYMLAPLLSWLPVMSLWGRFVMEIYIYICQNNGASSCLDLMHMDISRYSLRNAL